MALSFAVKWSMVDNQADVTHALFRIIIQQIIAGDGREQGAESQNHAEEYESKVTLDEDRLRFLRTPRKMFNYFGRVEKFVAGRIDCGRFACLHKSPGLYSVSRRVGQLQVVRVAETDELST